jgi:hypothetical protein
MVQSHTLLFSPPIKLLRKKTRNARLANRSVPKCDKISLLALPENFLVAASQVNKAQVRQTILLVQETQGIGSQFMI